MKYLKKRYNILGDEEIRRFLENKLDHQSKKNLIITFDDGDRTNFSEAFPILRKYNIPAVFFIITELINSKKPFWWDEIQNILGKQVGEKKVWEIKKWTNQERLAFLENLRNNNCSTSNYVQLTDLQLKKMGEAGMVIGNHSHTHPMFDQCSSQEIHEELEKSIDQLEKWKFSPEYFAYPNGNFSIDAEKQLKENGIKYAFLFDHKINRGDINPLRISRLVVNDTTPLWKFKFILSGWHSKVLPLTKALNKIRK